MNAVALPTVPPPVVPGRELVLALRKLTPMQRKVLRTMLANDISVWAAARRLGHSSATCHNWMRKPNFARAHELVVQQAINSLGITAHYVLGRTKQVVERCMQETPVLDSEGKATGEYQFRENGALKGLELLGRHTRLWGTDDATKPAADGPGLTVIVQTAGSQVGVQAPADARGTVVVNLPEPEK